MAPSIRGKKSMRHSDLIVMRAKNEDGSEVGNSDNSYLKKPDFSNPTDRLRKFSLVPNILRAS